MLEPHDEVPAGQVEDDFEGAVEPGRRYFDEETQTEVLCTSPDGGSCRSVTARWVDGTAAAAGAACASHFARRLAVAQPARPPETP